MKDEIGQGYMVTLRLKGVAGTIICNWIKKSRQNSLPAFGRNNRKMSLGLSFYNRIQNAKTHGQYR